MPGFLKNALTVFGSVVAFALIAEIALRFLGISYPVFMRSDDQIGWSFTPGLSGWSVHESVARVEINRHGFRGPDWSVEKPVRTYRIAFLGDSFVEASNLAFEDSIGMVLQRSLAECPVLSGQDVEVLNFGVSGYGTDQAYLLLDTALRFDPDAVVLGFFVGNDVNNNHFDLALRPQHLKPFFELDDSGQLVRDDRFRDDAEFSRAWLRTHVLGTVINNSALLQLVKQAMLTGIAVPDDRGSEETSFDPISDAERSVKPNEPMVYAAPVDPAWRQAWSVTEALIAEMSGRLKDADLPLLVAMIPDPAELNPDIASRHALAAERGYDFDYPARRLSELGEREDIDVLSLAEPLGRDVAETRRYLYGWPPKLGSGHLNETGNRLAGEEIARRSCDRISSTEASPS